MRQTISIFLLFSVLLSSTGITLSKHFCGEALAHITLNETKTCCEGEEADMPGDCCHDEFDQLLLNDSQIDHQTLQLQPLAFFTLSILAHFLSFSSEVVLPVSPWTAFHSPPYPA